ncbi:MAG: phage head closure protein [Acidobacteriota bacterium]|nr:phage head closure protein [Acidobacteriota bacterium]
MESIGQLDRCIRIEGRSQAQDSYGEQIETFTIVDSVRAAVKYMRGSEPFQGDQYNAKRVVQFTIRYRTGIDETARIVWEGDTYDIDYINQKGRHQWLEIVGTALVPTI